MDKNSRSGEQIYGRGGGHNVPPLGFIGLRFTHRCHHIHAFKNNKNSTLEQLIIAFRKNHKSYLND